jgi:hypothetical protein
MMPERRDDDDYVRETDVTIFEVSDDVRTA